MSSRICLVRTVAPGGFTIGGMARNGPRGLPGECRVDRRNRAPLGARRAATALTGRCVALVQLRAGALRYVPAYAASVPLAKQANRTAAAIMCNRLIGMAPTR